MLTTLVILFVCIVVITGVENKDIQRAARMAVIGSDIVGEDMFEVKIEGDDERKVSFGIFKIVERESNNNTITATGHKCEFRKINITCVKGNTSNVINDGLDDDGNSYDVKAQRVSRVCDLSACNKGSNGVRPELVLTTDIFENKGYICQPNCTMKDNKVYQSPVSAGTVKWSIMVKNWEFCGGSSACANKYATHMKIVFKALGRNTISGGFKGHTRKNNNAYDSEARDSTCKARRQNMVMDRSNVARNRTLRSAYLHYRNTITSRNVTKPRIRRGRSTNNTTSTGNGTTTDGSSTGSSNNTTTSTGNGTTTGGNSTGSNTTSSTGNGTTTGGSSAGSNTTTSTGNGTTTGGSSAGSSTNTTTSTGNGTTTGGNSTGSSTNNTTSIGNGTTTGGNSTGSSTNTTTSTGNGTTTGGNSTGAGDSSGWGSCRNALGTGPREKPDDQDNFYFVGSETGSVFRMMGIAVMDDFTIVDKPENGFLGIKNHYENDTNGNNIPGLVFITVPVFSKNMVYDPTVDIDQSGGSGHEDEHYHEHEHEHEHEHDHQDERDDDAGTSLAPFIPLISMVILYFLS